MTTTIKEIAIKFIAPSLLAALSIILFSFSFHIKKEVPPEFLYKIVSLESWEKSQEAGQLLLSPADTPFIHLATEEQVGKIAEKYWIDTPYVLVKLVTHDLPGKLVLEANPGGTNRYYHLYDGFIPMDAVVDYWEQQ